MPILLKIFQRLAGPILAILQRSPAIVARFAKSTGVAQTAEAVMAKAKSDPLSAALLVGFLYDAGEYVTDGFDELVEAARDMFPDVFEFMGSGPPSTNASSNVADTRIFASTQKKNANAFSETKTQQITSVDAHADDTVKAFLPIFNALSFIESRWGFETLDKLKIALAATPDDIRFYHALRSVAS